MKIVDTNRIKTDSGGSPVGGNGITIGCNICSSLWNKRLKLFNF